MSDEKLDEALLDRVARNAAVLLSGTDWSGPKGLTEPELRRARPFRVQRAVAMALQIEIETANALHTKEAVDNYV